MQLTSVKLGDVQILVDLIASLSASFIAINPRLLPDDFSRRIGFDGAAWSNPPIEQVIRAISESEPAESYTVDYCYSGGILDLKVTLPFGSGVKIHSHHPVLCSADRKKGIFLAIARVDRLRSDVVKGTEIVEFSSSVVLSWDMPEITLEGRQDWKLNDE